MTTLRISFSSIDHVAFHRLVQMAATAPKDEPPQIMSSKTLRRHMGDEIEQAMATILEKLPTDGKISIAVDAWTSPNYLGFLAITG